MDRESTEQFIHENFGGILADQPWDDLPEYTVFRHADNHKWFALVATVSYATLAKQNPARFSRLSNLNLSDPVNFINLKSDPDLIEEATKLDGILPAYHMNKRHWLTVLLDGSCEPEKVKHLITLSYRLTSQKRRTS